jgi:hypothetical protein
MVSLVVLSITHKEKRVQRVQITRPRSHSRYIAVLELKPAGLTPKPHFPSSCGELEHSSHLPGSLDEWLLQSDTEGHKDPEKVMCWSSHGWWAAESGLGLIPGGARLCLLQPDSARTKQGDAGGLLVLTHPQQIYSFSGKMKGPSSAMYKLSIQGHTSGPGA